MPPDESYHRFAMLERSVRHFARQGTFDQAVRLYRELVATDLGEPRYSRLKWRFAAELAKEALVRQRRQVAEEFIAVAEAGIPPEHLDGGDREIMDRVRTGLAAL